jgi:hypothetical protein
MTDQKPLTDEDLARLAAAYDPSTWRMVEAEKRADRDVTALLAEVRRLRAPGPDAGFVEMARALALETVPPLPDESIDAIEARAGATLSRQDAAGTWTPVADVKAIDAIPRAVAPTLTDQGLAAMLEDLGSLLEALGKPGNVARPESPQAVMRECIADVRRLRGDEWLQRAADEIGEKCSSGEWEEADVLAILRKHWDGRA